jgi:ligand-binding sensor domain-containing protein/signal transduction histidine kinase
MLTVYPGRRNCQTIRLLFLAAASLQPLLGATPSAVSRKNSTYGVDFWREAEGFRQSRVRAIVQTRDGYIWLGTDGGLVRFNGETFTAFTTETGSLEDNEVWALLEDGGGGLWIGTYGGGLTLLKDGQFRTFTSADGLPDDVIMSLSKDREGGIWMRTPRGLGRYSGGVFTRITTRDGLPEAHATAVCGSSPEGVLAATRSGIYRLADNRFEPVPSMSSGNAEADYLLCASDGAVWVGLSTGLIERYKGGVTTTFRSPPDAGSQIHFLYEDPHGGVWAAWGKRITSFRNGAFETVAVEGGPAALGRAYSLCMDREGGVWVGLQSNGVARLRSSEISTLSVEQGLPDERTRAVFEDRRGDIWIGTADGLARYHEGRITTWRRVQGTILGDVRSIAEDSKGTLWISSGRDLLRFEDGHFVPVPGWGAVAEIEVLFKDPTGKMWIATDGAGLFEYSGGGFRNYRAPDGLGSDHVRAIMADRSGVLWISTFGSGVSKFINGTFTTVSVNGGLAGDRVVAMHEDEEGALWFATRRGLSRLKDGAFFTWTSKSGMLTDFVYAVIDDGRGNFWFSSAQGLFKVGKRELRGFAAGAVKRIVPVAYGVKDGLQTLAGNLGNQPVALKTSSGDLLFTTMKGLVVVQPDRIGATTFLPPVYIDKVIINKQEQPPNRYVQIPAGAGDIEIHYAALSYSAPEKMRFRYILESVDQDWIDAGGRRFTYYANLRPGKYRFRVTAGKADGARNETGASFSFYLKPPFYRTSSFAVVVVSSVLLLAVLMYWLRVRSLRARYSAVLAERNRISRDIHDTLSQNLAGIALQLDAVHMQLPDCESDLRQRLDEACNLTRYSLAEARRAIADLRSDDLDCPELSAALPEIAQRVAVALPTSVQVIGDPRKLNPAVERNLLRIFQEALTNAVKHAHARTVDVELKYGSESLALRVRDDGDGFDLQSLSTTGNGHYGLIGMRERAERIGGRLTLNSRPGEGTELLVEVPL